MCAEVWALLLNPELGEDVDGEQPDEVQHSGSSSKEEEEDN